jgi:hypothetical protein
LGGSERELAAIEGGQPGAADRATIEEEGDQSLRSQNRQTLGMFQRQYSILAAEAIRVR